MVASLKIDINLDCTGRPNLKKGMAILILALANYLLNIVSPKGPTMFGAGMNILGFRVPKMHFPALFHGHISVPKHPIFCTMYHKISIHLPP